MVYVVFGLYILFCVGSDVRFSDWAQQSRFLSENGDKSPVSETLFLYQNRTMENVQKLNHVIKCV
jgi:hypothetical protein